jgi:hypothetical protein
VGTLRAAEQGPLDDDQDDDGTEAGTEINDREAG